jgi:hypothetical protein
MIVEFWTMKREMGDEDENDMEDTSNRGYNLADWVGMTSGRWYYTPDRDLSLLYEGW